MAANYCKSIRTVYGYKTPGATNKAYFSFVDTGKDERLNHLPTLIYHPFINPTS